MDNIDLEWLDSQVVKSPLEQFIALLGGTTVINIGIELVIKTSVARLVRALEPRHEFILDGQRAVDNERVEIMYNSQRADYDRTNHYRISTTIISLGFCTTQNKPKILDGQHRLAVLSRILHFHPETLVNEEIFVKILVTDSEMEQREHFQAINRNYVPVPLYNIDETTRSVVDGVLRWFKVSFDGFFFRTSETGDVNRPFINLDGCGKNLRDWLSDNQTVKNIIGEKNGDVETSIQTICGKLERYNNVLKRRDSEYFMVNDKDSVCNNAYNKCLGAKRQLFLGMRKNYALILEALLKTVITIKPRPLI